jgi:hypothetical protein
MTSHDDLIAHVDDAFVVTGAGTPQWPDPHPDRQPLDEEYSRVTDPAKWRIIDARAEAWIVALTEAGLATVEREVEARWQEHPGTVVAAVDRVVPGREGALAITLAASAIDGVPACGLTFGLGDPAVCIGWLPDCGCDACDSGSRNELEQLDRWVAGVVLGSFRRLTRGDQVITVFDDSGWQATNISGRGGKVQRILADPRGWHELRGRAW